MEKLKCPKGESDRNKLTFEERMENAIQHEPDRYVVCRDKDNNLTKVYDKDSDFLHIKGEEGGKPLWIWVA